MKCAFLLIFAANLCFLQTTLACKCTQTYQAFGTAEIVPDILTEAPHKALQVTYGTNTNVELGNVLLPSATAAAPTTFSFRAHPTSLYTILMVDPDVPSSENPTGRSYRHWTVINALGGDITTGQTLGTYQGPAPPQNSGSHRYVFLIYKQTANLNIPTDPPITGFDVAQFAQQHNLGTPIYGNFFLAEYEASGGGSD